jgi:large subunit ribosomal protein L3
MTDNNGIHSGSLQFYPRVRAKKTIPSANWKNMSQENVGLLGFLGYKVGMVSLSGKDETPDSLTKGKKIIIPATILECPSMKIYSVRFYKEGKVSKDVVVSNDKILKKKLGTVKISELVEHEFDDLRVILYSEIKKTGIGRKKPNLVEVGLSGSKEEKLVFVKEKINKEISVLDLFPNNLVDVRAVTKGYGTQGPVRRFGIALKDHKSEKGQRRPGSLAPWHPARVTFRAPQAGQTGYQNRVSYNHVILEKGKISEKDINKKGGFEHYGMIKNDYVILRGSIPGPKKRGILITSVIRPTKKQSKKKFEMLEIR